MHYVDRICDQTEEIVELFADYCEDLYAKDGDIYVLRM